MLYKEAIDSSVLIGYFGYHRIAGTGYQVQAIFSVKGSRSGLQAEGLCNEPCLCGDEYKREPRV